MEVFIGRQPILNGQEQIVAYELLYRNRSDANKFNMVDSDVATVDVLLNSFISVGTDEVTKGRPCFVNFTENLLMGTILDYLNPKQVVIEILEDVPLTEELVKRIAELKNRGYQIALDDFILEDHVKVYDELFQYIDFIKVDFLLSPQAERMEIENKVKRQFPHIKLLAEKVETREQYEAAKKTGYVLFQGYFFEQPQIIISTDIPANTMQYFHVISLLRDDEPNINQIAANIERDISMSYKLLQLINSSQRRTKSKVRSIKQAILLLGLTELRKWVYLLAMREMNKNQDDEIFNELMRVSLFKAKVCEKIARLNYKENFSEYFLIGLFSLIDGILKRPLNVILSQLPFSEEIIETLSGVETDMTPILRFSSALYKLDWDLMDELSSVVHLDRVEMIQIYDEVNDWIADSFTL